MRILLTGVSGQLGQELRPILARLGDVATLDRAACDLSLPGSLRAVIRRVQPDVIVNPAAYTNVNGAEKDRDTAMAVNGIAPGVLAEEAARLGALLVHYSTDYVFDGEKAGEYVEGDPARPLNVYGESKLAGEQAIERAGGRYLVLRTSWVYSAHGANFLHSILRLAGEREELSIVDDQVGAPTSTPELARATARLIEQTTNSAGCPSGVYHATAAGAVSWCGFAQEIVERARQSGPIKTRAVKPIPSASYPTPAKRPLNSRLSNAKFQNTFGFVLADWRAGLDEVMQQLEVKVP